ncbi:MAG: hypothetical protein OXG36_04470 [Caldilineaceae bacterium]|nr:hypothetical protein [Caldilineaceae bacterium]
MQHPLIKVVGVSAAGKSTLVATLEQLGMHARCTSQEHSYVKDMWQRLHPPDILIFLHADLGTQLSRRPWGRYTEAGHREELERLGHALAHADLVIETSPLTKQEVVRTVRRFLDDRHVSNTPGSSPN